MKQRSLFLWILVPALGILWWQGQQQPTPPTTTSADIPTAKIAVIDSRAFSSEQGIQQLVQQIKLFDEKYRSRFEDLQKVQREVEALQQEIRTKAANWTIEVQQQKQEELEEKQRRAKRLGEDLQREYQRELARVTDPISERVRSHLQQYATRRGITIVLDLAPLNQAGAVPYLDQAIDVTQDFINDYNRAYPALQPPRSR